MSWEIILLATAAGLVAGIINTLAGSGSAVTLAMLFFLGLPADAANATNRIGVIAQNLVGIGVYHRAGAMSLSSGGSCLVAAAAGAIAGALLATDLDSRTMEIAIGAMLVVVLIAVVLGPQHWLRERAGELSRRRRVLLWPIYFAVGVYGGFIQAGVGIFLLAAMVVGGRMTLVGANGIKLAVVLAMNVLALGVFVVAAVGIDWWAGAVLAVGQIIGAWLAARFATEHPRAPVWIRRLLILLLAAAIPSFFGVY
jgi:hypothetical protein